MYIDDKIVMEFIRKDRTCQWFRSYLIQAKEEQDQPEPDTAFIPDGPPPPAPPSLPLPAPTYTHLQKIAILIEAYRNRQLFLNQWEYDFLIDNQATPRFTPAQIFQIEKFWRRITV
jgi:hypothetical protein